MQSREIPLARRISRDYKKDITDEADLDSIKDSIIEEIGSSDAGDDDDRAYEDAKDRRLMGEDY